MEGPVAWITSGKFDAVLDFRFPPEEETDINALIGELADAITTAASQQAARLVDRIPGQRELAKPAISPPEESVEVMEKTEAKRVMTVDIDLRFRDLKASVPLFTNDLTYVNNALIRPIVAFIKCVFWRVYLRGGLTSLLYSTNKTLVPIHCRIVKDLSDFEGAWTVRISDLASELLTDVGE